MDNYKCSYKINNYTKQSNRTRIKAQKQTEMKY